jgi:hypothetical protein
VPVKSLIAAVVMMPMLVCAKPPGSDFTVASVDTICISLKQLTEITDEAQELPYLRGQSHPIMTEGAPLSMVIFVNPATGTFTIAERVAQDMYCLLALGSQFGPVPAETRDRIMQEQQKSRL